MTREEQRAKWREYYHKTHPQKEPKNFFHQKLQRIVTRDHYATRIYWNRDMLDLLKRSYPNTLNEELAGMLGVSVRTMIRKARELGLTKDKMWLDKVWDERRIWAQAASKQMGYPGSIKPGQHLSPATEFKKGHTPTNQKNNRDMKKIYISGPISGYDIEERRKAFEDIQTFLESWCYEPVNPMNNGLPAEATIHEHMKRDFELLLTCDAIYMMKRWTHSKGCKVEFDVATAIGLPVFFEESNGPIKFE